MTDIRRPICDHCQWNWPIGERTCKAFPGGIPDAIWWSEADHRRPYAGDQGIRWLSDGSLTEAEILDQYGPPGTLGKVGT